VSDLPRPPKGPHGGKRAGAGRPQISNYEGVFADLEPPPDDPLELVTWAQKINARALFETVQGRGHKLKNQEIRTFAKVIAALVPKERIYKAEQSLKPPKKRRKPPTATGPTMEEREPRSPGSGGPLRA
jgi:hypothetical protein